MCDRRREREKQRLQRPESRCPLQFCPEQYSVLQGVKKKKRRRHYQQQQRELSTMLQSLHGSVDFNSAPIVCVQDQICAIIPSLTLSPSTRLSSLPGKEEKKIMRAPGGRRAPRSPIHRVQDNKKKERKKEVITFNRKAELNKSQPSSHSWVAAIVVTFVLPSSIPPFLAACRRH